MSGAFQMPRIMGIVNVTPDSFSDGGDYFDPQKAIAHGVRLASEGADILDVGGESTRPGAAPVSAAEEMRRVLPVIEGLRGCGKEISIDTRHAVTMREAVRAGATMINDITALAGDPDALDTAAALGVQVCLMHMRGTPQTMQHEAHYDNVVEDVFAYLEARIASCVAAGIEQDRLIVDPGIGFAKTLSHNLQVLKHIGRYKDLGVRVLLGASRKRFIADVAGDIPAAERDAGTLAVTLWAAAQRVDIHRVHNVSATRQALQLWQAIRDC